MAAQIREFTPEELKQISDDLERKTAQEVITWAIDHFHPHIALASSFGVEDVALIDIVSRLTPPIRVFTLDTGRLPEETYDV
ncbi:MAG: phosphoadenylyl-sulfate reductase, partial [Chloroflexota bacterium]|nr:phosphoadenylyl-sulfate reductase [Chloroflexota bacterium]